jgi:hypothetical protein
MAYKLLIRVAGMLWREVIVKKAWLYIIGAVFLFSTLAFAADKIVPPAKINPVKAGIVKAAVMHATGKVVEISDASIKIERTIKGDIETMEFALDKPLTNIIINDSVKIEYTEKDGKLTASKVSKVTLKKKEVKLPETKSVSGKK